MYISKLSVAGVFCISSTLSQSGTDTYPDWFLKPPSGHRVGIAKSYSKPDVSREMAATDALAMYYLTHGGEININSIYTNGRLADSLALDVGTMGIRASLKLIAEAFIQNMYLALYKLEFEGEIDSQASAESAPRVYAIGRQSIHPDKVYESWGSAEIEAYKELSRIKTSKLRSIEKMGGSRHQSLISLRSQSQFRKARVERRWIEGYLLLVEVSDLSGSE